jgi:hypothetical protein
VARGATKNRLKTDNEYNKMNIPNLTILIFRLSKSTVPAKRILIGIRAQKRYLPWA